MYEVLSNLMELQGVTPYRLSKETGITQATLSRWKNGITQPSIETLQTLADYFGVTVDYLTGNESHRYHPTKELFELRKILGQDFKLRVHTIETGLCKEFDNGYSLIVFCRGFSSEYFNLYVEVRNYTRQPFIYEEIDPIISIDSLKNVLSKLEEKYKSLPPISKNESTDAQKEKPTLPKKDEPEITFDDFTYAFLDESKELTEENKQKLLEMAKFFRQQQDKEQNN
ncbi:MAG: helix-turn-helix domain-containing protein [Clostridium sp.]|nr:helix-turn-helix domain-containing protein [Clostridium sp.]